MKISKLAAICKTSKHAVIFQDDSYQWISDGYAAYRVEGLPKLSKESLLTIFDVEKEAQEKWFVSERGFPEGIDIEEPGYEEQQVIPTMPTIESKGKQYLCLPIESRRILFFDTKYLNPLADLKLPEYFLRKSEEGNWYLVVSDGLFIKAIIMQANIVNETLCKMYRELSFRMDAELELRKALKETRVEKDIFGRVTHGIDVGIREDNSNGEPEEAPEEEIEQMEI